MGLFAVLSVSWLPAPLIHHHNLLDIRFISFYEASGQPYAALYRSGDALAAGLLIILVLMRQLLTRDRIMGLALLGIATLTLVDVFFPSSCELGSCGSGYISVHVFESLLSLLLGFAAVAHDAWRGHRLSQFFFFFQIVGGVLFLGSAAAGQAFNGIQYLYQVVLVAWIVWIIGRRAPSTH